MAFRIVILIALVCAVAGIGIFRERTLWQVSVNVSITGDPAEPLGSVFQWRGTEDLTCAAGFIATNSSTISSNQNELEFWCKRAGIQTTREWRSLGRPTKRQIRSFVANVGGKLFDYESHRVHRRANWIKYQSHEDGYAKRKGGSIARLQKVGDNRFSLVSEWNGCAGLSILSQDGYHGSIRGTSPTFFIYAGRVYANLDLQIVSFPIGPGRDFEDCSFRVDGTVHNSEENRIYSMLPSDGALYVGGSLIGRNCAELYQVRDGKLAEIPVAVGRGYCEDRQINEFYSYTVFRDDLIIGTYPNGNLVRVRDGKAVLTDQPFGDVTRRRYRESQSLTIAAGDLFVGMYPWGEVFSLPYGATDWRRKRIFAAPPIDGAFPYKVAMTKMLLDLSANEKKQRARRRGLFATAWGQRVTTLAVLNGRLCAGTGNMSGSPWSPDYHAMVSKTAAEQYGQVFCLDLPNQTAGNIRWKRSTRLTFKVTDRRLIVEQDNVEVFSATHELTDGELAVLSREGGFEFGNGVYGRFRGEVER